MPDQDQTQAQGGYSYTLNIDGVGRVSFTTPNKLDQNGLQAVANNIYSQRSKVQTAARQRLEQYLPFTAGNLADAMSSGRATVLDRQGEDSGIPIQRALKMYKTTTGLDFNPKYGKTAGELLGTQSVKTGVDLSQASQKGIQSYARSAPNTYQSYAAANPFHPSLAINDTSWLPQGNDIASRAVRSLVTTPASFGSGLIGAVGSLGQSVQMIGHDLGADKIPGAIGPLADPSVTNFLQAAAQAAQPKESDQTPINSVAENIGAAVPYIGGAILTGGTADLPLIGGRIMQAATAGGLNALANLSSNYNSARANGLTDEEARKSAYAGMVPDFALGSIAEGAGLFAPAKSTGAHILKSILGQALMGAQMKTTSNLVSGQDNPFSGAVNQAIIGGVTGGVFGALHGIPKKNLPNEVLPDNVRQTLENSPNSDNPLVQHILGIDAAKRQQDAETKPTKAPTQSVASSVYPVTDEKGTQLAQGINKTAEALNLSEGASQAAEVGHVLGQLTQHVQNSQPEIPGLEETNGILPTENQVAQSGQVNDETGAGISDAAAPGPSPVREPDAGRTDGQPVEQAEGVPAGLPSHSQGAEAGNGAENAEGSKDAQVERLLDNVDQMRESGEVPDDATALNLKTRIIQAAHEGGALGEEAVNEGPPPVLDNGVKQGPPPVLGETLYKREDTGGQVPEPIHLYHGTQEAFQGNPKDGSWWTTEEPHADAFANKPNRPKGKTGRTIGADFTLGKVLDLSDQEIGAKRTVGEFADKLGISADDLMSRLNPGERSVLEANEKFGGMPTWQALKHGGIDRVAKELGFDAIKASEKTSADGRRVDTYQVFRAPDEPLARREGAPGGVPEEPKLAPEGIWRGKQAILGKIEESFNNGELFGKNLKQYRIAKAFIQAMPESVLKRLGLTIKDTADPGVKGMYLGGLNVAVLMRNVASDHPFGTAYVLAHEIGHHLEQFVDGRDKSALERQFKAEIQSGRFRVLDAYQSYKELAGKTPQEILSNPKTSRLAFAEWFADKIATKAYARIEKSQMGLWQRTLTGVRDLAHGVVDFLARRGMYDKAEDVLNKILLGSVDKQVDFKGVYYQRDGKPNFDSSQGGLEKVATAVYRTSEDPSIDGFRDAMESRFGKGAFTDAELFHLHDIAGKQVAEDKKGELAGGLEKEFVFPQEDPHQAESDVTTLTNMTHAAEDRLRNAFPSLPERPTTGPRSWGEVAEKAQEASEKYAAMTGGKPLAEYLTDQVLDDKQKTLSDLDQAVLANHVIDLRDSAISLHSSAKDALESGNDAMYRDLRSMALDKEAAMDRTLAALGKTGSELGRALNARKMIVDDTFLTDGRRETMLETLKGRELTDEEKTKAAGIGDRILKAKDRISIANALAEAKKVKADLEKKLNDLQKKVNPNELTELQRRRDELQSQIDHTKGIRDAIKKNSKAVTKAEKQLNGLVTDAQSRQAKLDERISKLKENPDYAGPGIDLVNLYEGELRRITLEMASAKDSSQIAGLHKELTALRAELNKGREYTEGILTGRKTPGEILKEKGEGSGLDRSKNAVGDTTEYPWLKPLRESFDKTAEHLSELNKQLQGTERSTKARRERIAQLNEEIRTGNFTGKDAVTDEDYVPNKPGQEDPRVTAAKQELAKLQDEERRFVKERNMRREIQDIMSRIDLGSYIKEPRISPKETDQGLLNLKKELDEARYAGDQYSKSMEPQGVVEMIRMALRSNTMGTNLIARAKEFTSGALMAMMERNPISKAMDRNIDRALFPKAYEKVGSAFGPGLLNGFSISDNLGMAVDRMRRQLQTVYSKDTLSRAIKAVLEGDDVYARKYGTETLRVASHFDNPLAKAIAGGIDKAGNTAMRTTAFMDRFYSTLFNNGVMLDMVDSMVEHMGRQARKQGVEFDPMKARETILKNENGELDEVRAVAQHEAEAAVFMDRGLIGNTLGKLWKPEFYKPALKGFPEGMQDNLANVPPLMLDVFVTRYVNIFARITNMVTDYAFGGAKAAAHRAMLGKAEAPLSIADRRNITKMIRRNLYGLAIGAFASAYFKDKDKLDKFGKFDKEHLTVDYGPAQEIGGPLGAFFKDVTVMKANRLLEQKEITPAERDAMVNNSWRQMIASQPAISGAYRALQQIEESNSDIRKFVLGQTAQSLIPGLVSEGTKTLDQAQNKVFSRKTSTPEDSLGAAFTKEIQARVPENPLFHGRQSLPMGNAGLYYPGLSQQEQAEFQRLNYQPEKPEVRPTEGLTEDLVKQVEPVRKSLVTAYVKDAIASPFYKSLPDTLPPEKGVKETDTNSKRGVLKAAVRSAIQTATGATSIGLSQSDIGGLRQWGAELPESLYRKQPGETPEEFSARQHALKAAYEKAIPRIGEAFLQAQKLGIAVPPEQRSNFVNRGLSQIALIVNKEESVDSVMRSAFNGDLVAKKTAEAQKKAFGAILLSVSQ